MEVGYAKIPIFNEYLALRSGSPKVIGNGAIAYEFLFVFRCNYFCIVSEIKRDIGSKWRFFHTLNPYRDK